MPGQDLFRSNFDIIFQCFYASRIKSSNNKITEKVAVEMRQRNLTYYYISLEWVQCGQPKTLIAQRLCCKSSVDSDINRHIVRLHRVPDYITCVHLKLLKVRLETDTAKHLVDLCLRSTPSKRRRRDGEGFQHRKGYSAMVQHIPSRTRHVCGGYDERDTRKWPAPHQGGWQIDQQPTPRR